ncbi:hypothetical protein [Leisingera sp. ANG-Vp]|uniref:hypothetical protein n=1 Tax=Leisingera sp. ANG-Vp TaxID=1577896 RepID=UPI00057FD86F|nr:hypothetical protein [Leisingera sp. ANG-Vp]KIC17543.1 hypothetical protein RA20_14350 [Leisingera sp. ANG-Vp]
MAEKVEYTGRLGLEYRDSGTLSAAVTAVVDTLDDFGHPADRIEARAENTAKLQSDHYLVTVRLRRVPLRRASKLTSSMLQPAAFLELSLTSVYPSHCDQEISELLLAETLRRLLPEVEATSVEWLDSDVALTCEQFLSAFEPRQQEAERAAAAPLQEALPRPRGRDCFTPVEQTAQELEAHCDRAFAAARTIQAAAATRARMPAAVHNLSQGWGSRLGASVVAAFTLSSSKRLRFVSHLLLLTALILFLDSAGMVQAARLLGP